VLSGRVVDTRASESGGNVKAAVGTLRSLSWLNFTIAAMQAGFGPFVSVRLTASGWDPGTIGMVLSAGSIASVAAQVPSGAIIDHFGAKRMMAAVAIAGSISALLMLALAPSVPLVLGAEVVQGGAGVGLSLAVAAITLGVSRQERLGERFGRNVSFAAIGAALGTAGLGGVGSAISPNAAFLLAAAFGVPALLALRGIGADDLATAHTRTAHHTAPPPRARRSRPVPARALLLDRRLLALLLCVGLFQLANASLLPLAATEFTREAGRRADLVTAAAVIGPQLLAALLSPRVGRAAHLNGRRLVLMLGLAVVPLRALIFAFDGTIPVMLAAQLLDGVAAAVLGTLVPLIVADITHRGGRFNLALGMTGLAGAFGAALSTTASGSIADAAGLPVAFFALAAAAVGSILVVWGLLPETAHLPAAMPANTDGSRHA
jgi:MFS family permease